MYNDTDTNRVIISQSLSQRAPAVFYKIAGELNLTAVEGENIWTRDYMPVQVGAESFIKFRYGYGSDNKEFKNLRLTKESWAWLKEYGDVKDCDLRLDGGNIVHHSGRVIMTDIIFRHNRDVKRVVPRLESLLGCEITVVPTEPGDDIGHTDGICKFTPDGTLLVHNYNSVGTDEYKRYHGKLMESLSKFKVVVCPLASAQCPKMTEPQFRSLFPQADTFNPGYGYYLNMLVTGNLVFVPQFNIQQDAEMVKLVKKHFAGFKIVPVDCALLSMEGGLIGCVTTQYRL